jgi:hypothetical protein
VKIIAVVGTGSGCGKTTVACSILRGLPGLGAVKISPHEAPSRIEWGAGAPGKDTDLYAVHGAAPVARIIGPRAEVAQSWGLIRDRFRECRGVVFEGACALDLPEELFTVFVVGEQGMADRERRNREILARADLVLDRSSTVGDSTLVSAISVFLLGPAADQGGSCP